MTDQACMQGVSKVSGNTLGGQYLIINIMGGIHTCRTVWAQLVNHTMKQLQLTLDLYYQSKRWYVSLTTANIIIQTITWLCLIGSWSDSLYYYAQATYGHHLI